MFGFINKTIGCCGKIFGCSNKNFICCPNFVAVTKPFFSVYKLVKKAIANSACKRYRICQ